MKKALNHCKNCGTELRGPYCYQCGQEAKVERLTAVYLWHELFDFFTHIEKGFLYTSLQLLRRPAHTIKEFIEGNRRKYQRPVSYFLIWTAIFILFLYILQRLFGADRVIDYNNYFGTGPSTNLAVGHLNVVLIAIIPFLAFYFYLFLAPKKYNYVESAVAIIYYLGTIILLQFVFALLALVAHAITGASVDLHLSDIFKIAYLAWFTIDVTRTNHTKSRLIKGLCFALLTFGTFTCWRVYLYPGLAGYFFH